MLKKKKKKNPAGSDNQTKPPPDGLWTCDSKKQHGSILHFAKLIESIGILTTSHMRTDALFPWLVVFYWKLLFVQSCSMRNQYTPSFRNKKIDIALSEEMVILCTLAAVFVLEITQQQKKKKK